MKFDESIMVMSVKGTPPSDPTTPAAFTVCTACKRDLVFDARNKPRMKAENIKPYCADCAADLVFADRGGRPTMAKVEGMLDGKPTHAGVAEFLDKLDARAKERVH